MSGRWRDQQEFVRSGGLCKGQRAFPAKGPAGAKASPWETSGGWGIGVGVWDDRPGRAPVAEKHSRMPGTCPAGQPQRVRSGQASPFRGHMSELSSMARCASSCPGSKAVLRLFLVGVEGMCHPQTQRWSWRRGHCGRAGAWDRDAKCQAQRGDGQAFNAPVTEQLMP